MRILSVVLLFGLLAACVGADRGQFVSANVVASLSDEADSGFARAYAPRDLTFPADHGAHPDFQTEWWYYTGNLITEAGGQGAGNRYGYQLTIFRNALSPTMPERTSDLATNQVYMAHLALTDENGNRHVSFERFSRGAGGLAGAQGEPRYTVWLENWGVEETEPGISALKADTYSAQGEHFGLDLHLRETRAPVLHGEAGLSRKGPDPGNASYYYSLVGLETSGEITVAGTTEKVTGWSWMDHEFGTSALSKDAVGWDWFSIQLDNGVALMFAQLRTADGESLLEFDGTLVLADDTRNRIQAHEIELTVLDEWTSADTSITYPSGWKMALPAYDLSLTIKPLIRAQEMLTSFVYWEGAVVATGEMESAPITGAGYVELTGYGPAGGSLFQR